MPDGLSVPQEPERREERLALLAEAKAKIEARAKERFEREQAEHGAKMKARADKDASPTAGPAAKDQVNLTDEDSRIMPVVGGGFEQAFNAQAAVATGSMLVVTADVVQAANDKQQIAPTLEQLGRLPGALGTPETLLADSGYFSAANVEACAQAGIAPLIAVGREHHHPSWRERFAQPAPAPDNPTSLDAMRHRLTTPRASSSTACASRPPSRCSASFLGLPTPRHQSDRLLGAFAT